MRNQRNKWFGLLIALVTLMTVSSASAKVVERIVAIVNGDVITRTELEDRIKLDSNMRSRNSTLRELQTENRRRVALDQLIDQTILNQEVKKSDIAVTDQEVTRAIQNILTQNGMNMQHLRAEIARKGMSFAQYEKNVEKEIKKIKFINQVISSEVKISDRDLRDYFDKHRGSFHGGKTARIAEIVLPFVGIDSEKEVIALRDKAIRIAREVHANPESFARLARQHSRGPNARQGGDLGTVNIDDLPSVVAEVVRSLPAGGVSSPIPTDNAVVIVKVIKWPRLSAEEFDKVRDTIYDRLHNERMSDALIAYIQRVKQNAYIEVR